MNIQTQKKLIEINNSFYKKIGTHFDATRNYFWPGWEKLIPIIDSELSISSMEVIKVLDIGCGNGRFLEFLVERFPDRKIEYIGIDGSDVLLEKAAERFSRFDELGTVEYELEKSDIVFEKWEKKVDKYKFDIIAMFGVMHHVPDLSNRRGIVRKASGLLSNQGVFVFTLWKFLDTERLKKRVVDTETEFGKDIYTKLGISALELDDHDYLLDWRKGEVAYRYCHYTSDDEINNILQDLKINIVDNYRADAKEGIVNHYLIVR